MASNHFEALGGDRNGQFNIRPIHPGEVLADELAELGITPAALARELHMPSNRLYQLS